MEEIDEDLKAIESKYSGNIEIKDVPRSVNASLIKLNKEFETVGLPKIDNRLNLIGDIFVRVMENVLTLTNMYRKTLRKLSNKEQILPLQKPVDWRFIEKYEKEHEEDQKRILGLENKLKLLNFDRDKLGNEIRSLKQEICARKKMSSDIVDHYEHKIKNLQQQNEWLKEKCGQSIGKYTSTDDAVVSLLNTYKLNEEVYKDAIKTLEETNHQLLNELVHLKYSDLNN